MTHKRKEVGYLNLFGCFRMERNQRVVLMPYKVWMEKLAKRLDVWYKTLEDCRGNTSEAASKLGLVERSFEVIGK